MTPWSPNMKPAYNGTIATVAISVSHIILAYSIFVMGHNGGLIAIFVSLTTILAGLAGYRLKKRIDGVLNGLEGLSQYKKG